MEKVDIRLDNVYGENSDKIGSPIEHKKRLGDGRPGSMVYNDRGLSSRQKKILLLLKETDDRIIIPRSSVDMVDLAALTLETGVEFALFTKGSERLVIRGRRGYIDFNIEDAKELNAQGYRWSGHTHPGIGDECLMESSEDVVILECFDQAQSVVYNARGKHRTFGKGWTENDE